LARTWKPAIAKVTNCPSCGAEVSSHGPGEKDYLMNLTKVLSGWTEEQINKIWKLRNAFIGHGNEHLTPEMGLELLEASFDAVRLAYDALNASLPGANLDGANSAWFITDVFLLEDSATGAQRSTADVAIRKEGSDWIVTVPTIEPRTFSHENPYHAIKLAKQYLESQIRRPVRSHSVPPGIVRIPIDH
jgi:hypothetical protein